VKGLKAENELGERAESRKKTGKGAEKTKKRPGKEVSETDRLFPVRNRSQKEF